MKDLWIYGSGGFGKEVATLIYAVNQQLATWNVKGFIDDDESKKEWFGLPVYESREIPGLAVEHLVVAIGKPAARSEIINRLKPFNLNYPALIHPTVILQHKESIAIGAGSILAAGSILTCDIKLGAHVIINLNCTIGHDVRMGDFSSLMCGINISGNVSLGEGVFVGSGANVLNNHEIGAHCKIGAGALVNHSFDANKRIVGVPARSI